MGIPGFNSWFAENNKRSYVTLSSVKVDHVYLDLNSILHTAMRNSTSWEKFHKRLHAVLNGVMDVIEPRKSVMLAVDGPAPLAKLLTQRERRKKPSRSKSDVKDSPELSSNALTPGTRFMADVTLSLAFWVYNKLTSRRFSHLMFELSDATVPGEGEVKILGRLAAHWSPQYQQDTHMIVGDDADLVLMACVSWVEGLYVANTVMSQGESRIQRGTQVFSVDKLHADWAATLMAPGQAAASQLPLAAQMLPLKMDLTLLAILAKGNDYLPGLQGLTLDRLWAHYKALRRGTGGAQLVLSSLDPQSQAAAVHLPTLITLLKACSRTSPPGARAESPLAAVKGSASAEQYLRGAIWLLHMYTAGECPDYRFCYDGLAPSASQTVRAAQQLLAQGCTTLRHALYEPLSAEQLRPLLPITSALALLPASCEVLLPAALRPLAASPTSPLADLYLECDECEQWSEENRALQAQMAACRLRVERLEAQLSRANAETADEVQQQELAAARAQYQECKKANLSLNNRRLQHQQAAHPYAPFPVERFVEAAASVPVQLLQPEERALASLSQPVVLVAHDRAGLLGRGRMMRPPPCPFAQNQTRNQSSMQVFTVVAGEPQLGQAARGTVRLVPDSTWVPSLGGRFISAPDTFHAKPPAKHPQQQARPQYRVDGSQKARSPPRDARQTQPQYSPAGLEGSKAVGGPTQPNTAGSQPRSTPRFNISKASAAPARPSSAKAAGPRAVQACAASRQPAGPSPPYQPQPVWGEAASSVPHPSRHHPPEPPMPSSNLLRAATAFNHQAPAYVPVQVPSASSGAARTLAPGVTLPMGRKGPSTPARSAGQCTHRAVMW
ncbi:XRN 5'-3' exonuclease N-terminus-domain-containing protein [Haematococcus lacustris]